MKKAQFKHLRNAKNLKDEEKYLESLERLLKRYEKYR